jgi:hypothetical protein
MPLNYNRQDIRFNDFLLNSYGWLYHEPGPLGLQSYTLIYCFGLKIPAQIL